MFLGKGEYQSIQLFQCTFNECKKLLAQELLMLLINQGPQWAARLTLWFITRMDAIMESRGNFMKGLGLNRSKL